MYGYNNDTYSFAVYLMQYMYVCVYICNNIETFYSIHYYVAFACGNWETFANVTVTYVYVCM